MSQKTNLNVSPYYDDFDPNSNYYRVLFKPGFPVQSRELSVLQSILQNQIKSFGNHIFKDGSIVIPGNISYNSSYYAVKINPTHVGLSVGLYLEQLVGKRIKGQTSQITAVVQNVIKNTESVTDDYTLYVKYITSDSAFNVSQFTDAETLVTLDSVTYGNTTISAGDTFATLINSEATFTASAVSISDGIYYIRGHFVNVAEDTIILDQYSNTPSYRVGLSISESIVDAQADNSLYDNARGFSNYAAPGADRLQISTKLSKKRLTDTDDKDFVEILRVSDGVVKKIQDTNQYSEIKEYIAKRTFEESGNYAVDPFNIEVENSLNDRLGSDGVFFPGQITEKGNTPTEDLLAIKVSPGKAYVRGYDIEKTSTTILDVAKPRTTRTVATSSVPFTMGNRLRLNNVSGTPAIGLNLNNNHIVELFNRRHNPSDTNAGTGLKVGTARAYSFDLADSDISDTRNVWDLFLWDIQTYTILTLSSGATSTEVPAGSYIEGVNSGASGYVASHTASGEYSLEQTSGSFTVGEQVTVNGSPALSRAIVNIKVFGIQDIKSVFQTTTNTSLVTAFHGDAVLTESVLPNFSSTDIISIAPTTGISTVAGRNFVGVKTDSIIQYTVDGENLPTFNRITGIATDGTSITLAATHSVTGINNSAITAGNYTFKVLTPDIADTDRAKLYSNLNTNNISNVSLTNSDLIVRRQAISQSSDNNGSITLNKSDIGITSSFFEPYALNRYSVIYSNGISADLASEQVVVSGDGESVTLSGLIANQSNIFVNATAKKVSVLSKKKNYIRSEKLEIARSANSALATESGLTQNNFYGLRIEDREISLNVPDVNKVIAIYESVDSGSVILDRLTFGSGLSLDTASILGEKIIGQGSGAVGQVVTRSSSTEVEFVYLNANRFSPNESVTFEESNIRSSILTVSKGTYVDKTNDYVLDKGQRDQYYDYSRIVRKSDFYIPSRRLTIIYDYYQVPSSDSGDVYTVNSYGTERYGRDIPLLSGNVRATDTLDFRPRVASFTSITASPFVFASRDFSAVGANSSLVIAPNESFNVGYSYYLPRIDKVVLKKDGEVSLIRGVASSNPVEPTSIDESMDLGTIELPAYLYNPDDAKITLTNNKRYTMQDLRELEDRIENVEELTSLTLLELDTKSLQVRDIDGLDKFKSGFFVDNFKGTRFINTEDPDANSTIDTNKTELRSDLVFSSLKSRVSPISTEDLSTLDFSSDFTLSDPSVKKTGDLVTLNYSSIEWTDVQQSFATKEQKVNPFGVENFNGVVKLTPSSDTWARTLNVQAGRILRSQSDWSNTYISNLITSSEVNNKLRSRNIAFEASGLQPSTNHYSFFGGSSNIDVIPKLLQVTMSAGSFQAGETVYGYQDGRKVSAFRLANANHKSGSYLNPSEVYSKNPYSPTLDIATVYSSSSPMINVDLMSLADDGDGRFYGYASQNMILVGESSSAQATVSAQSLTTDVVGDLNGCLFIRNPLTSPAPAVTFRSGSKTLKLTSSSINSNATNVRFTQETFHNNGVINSGVYTESVTVRRPPSALTVNATRRDPLSQTFRTDNTGGFLTKVGLFFKTKDQTEKVFVEIRETDIGGTPKNKVVQDFARVGILPADITVSTDGTTETVVNLPSPLYLQADTQYSLTLSCPTSDDYEVWVGETNQPTVATQNYPAADQVIYSNQYTGGNLYKPQNGSVWSPVISEDLKFKLYKAEFASTSGIVYFNNPSLSVGSTYTSADANIPHLVNNPIKTLPRKLIVGMSTSQALGTILVPGVKVAEGDNNGIIEFVGGNVGTVGISTVGVGYSNGTFNNVPLYTISGNGSGATANITISGNGVSAVSLASTGNGYRQGDLLGITTSSVAGTGNGALISVNTVPNIDTLYLTNMNGELFDTGDTISYYSGSTLVSMAGTIVRGTSVIPDEIYAGNVFEVSHYNHGMHSNSNIVNISGVEPNTSSSTLSAAIVSTDTTVSVANTSLFELFEDSPVTATNPGYVLVNDEIISYKQINVGSLEIVSRGENESTIRNHAVGDEVRKYELNGVSLTRINRKHDMPTNQSLVAKRDIDTYHLQVERPSAKTGGTTQLNFNTEGSFGGSNCSASQNIQFNEIIPYFNVVNPGNTSVSATLRTVSGTSAGGSEVSFQDQGYESVALNRVNELSTPRIVCSNINETTRLTTLPKNKSLTLGIRMETNNTALSPVVDLSEAATFVFARNRLNRPITNYVVDSRSNQNTGDPHASVYISNTVNLQRPASTLKVLLSSYRNSSSDFRVLYKLIRADSSEVEQTYELFPGYNNLTDANGDGYGDTVIDTSLNDGLPDSRVNPNVDGEYSEYQFTADNLDLFVGFTIKIVMSGTNEAYTAKFKDLRVIALA